MLKNPILKIDLSKKNQMHLLAWDFQSYKTGCKYMKYWNFKIFKLMKTCKILSIVKLSML
jgi:hypothetical protein